MSACPKCGGTLAALDGMCPRCVARSISSFLAPVAEAAPAFEVPGYELLAPLGRGGMGVVFRAVRESDGEVVAVKVMPPSPRGPAELAERFRREAAALAALEHPHILRIHDSGVCGDGPCFLVTDEAAGGDLARRLENGPPRVEVALRWFREVAGAIGEAHRRGIVHRDIKPANILLSAPGDDASALVADFSLAKLLDAGAAPPTLTMSGQVFGTPYYIPPEARHGGGADERGDIFSLGVLLHELLTGRVPIGSHVPASRIAKVPRAVDRLVARCLQEDSAQRPPDAAALLAELDSALRTRRGVLAAFLAVPLAGVALFFVVRKGPSPVEPARPVAATREQPFVNSLGMRFVPVAGTRVLFSVWETRRGDFEAFWKTRPGSREGPQAIWLRPPGEVTPAHPVSPVNLPLAMEFCQWLTETERASGIIPKTAAYRLPDDAEWSFAAGLGVENGATPEARHLSTGETARVVYPWGRSWPPPAGNFPANFAGQEAATATARLLHRDGFPATAPVGSFPANSAGIFDLSGNVAEWTSSTWNTAATEQVLRGGAWNQGAPESLRLDARQRTAPRSLVPGVGFRVVLVW